MTLEKSERTVVVAKIRSSFFMDQDGANGYRKHEPLEDKILKEIPTLFEEIIEVYRKDLGYTLSEFSNFIFMNEDEAESNYYRDNRPKLSLVK